MDHLVLEVKALSGGPLSVKIRFSLQSYLKPSKKIVLLLLTVLVLIAVGWLLINECAYGGGMGAAYRQCDCLGMEWELYDRTAADGPRKTVCLGIVQSTQCYQSMGGPRVACGL